MSANFCFATAKVVNYFEMCKKISNKFILSGFYVDKNSVVIVWLLCGYYVVRVKDLI